MDPTDQQNAVLRPSRPLRRLHSIVIGPEGLRPGWSACLFFLFWYLLSDVLEILFYPWLRGYPASPLAPAAGAAAELMQFLALLGATFLMARIERRPLLAYGYRGHARTLLLFSGLAWGFIALSALVFSLWKLGYLALDGPALHGAPALRDAALWAGVFLFGALFEESFLRGYPQFTLTRALGFWWGALLLSAAFGFGHHFNSGESTMGVIAAGAIGLVFCLSLWYTGSLWWAVGFHCAWDWSESYFYGTADSGLIVQGHLFREHPAGPVLWSGGATGPEGSVLILPLIVIMAFLMHLWWGRRVRSPFAGAGWRPMRPAAPIPPPTMDTRPQSFFHRR